jgi:hypothetical protein
VHWDVAVAGADHPLDAPALLAGVLPAGLVVYPERGGPDHLRVHGTAVPAALRPGAIRGVFTITIEY